MPDGPLVTAAHDAGRRAVMAADPAAAALGLRPGMAVAQALATVPGLHVMEAQPAEDADALLRLARWCHRATPLTAIAPPDGLWLDITGCAHLWGGEPALLQALLDRLARDGIAARAAVADTPGAAHAVARHAPWEGTPAVVAPGEQVAAVACLPIAALRLAPELVASLHRLGFEQVGHLARIPRALLARRFGPLPGLRLDQAAGRVHEVIRPLAAEHALQRRATFLEPLLTAEALGMAAAHVMEPLCREMEQAGLGARQADLVFERVDSHVAAVRIGTARPSRDAGHLVRLLKERLETVDPGLGVEAVHLVISLAEPLQWQQQDSARATQDVGRLVDRLSNRLGAGRLYRAVPLDSGIPERSVRCEAGLLRCSPAQAAEPPSPVPGGAGRRRGEGPAKPSEAVAVVQTAGPGMPDPVSLGWRRPWAWGRRAGRSAVTGGGPGGGPGVGPGLGSGLGVGWPGRAHAPSRLLEPPRPVKAIAALPNQPPAAFTWRGHRHRVCRADGPERVQGEWWRTDEERWLVRDYFRVEDESGRRFWLFREGNGIDPRTGDLSWYLHGLF